MATTLGRELDVNHSFYRWDDTVPSAEDKADLAAGRVPFISFNAITKAGAPVKWAAIAAGQEDAKLHEVAKGLKALGKPVFFTFNHEPENDQVKGTEADYRAAWKHVADVLKADGATNVVKVLVLMSGKIGTNDGYYPGDDVIDYVGGDTYNWAFSSHSPNAKWRSFEEAATPFYTWAKAKHKPILIAETGCVEDPTNPTHKAEWLKQMGETIKKWPELKAVCYFNNADAGDLNGGWYLGTAPAIAAFKQLAQDPYFSRH
jgi:beta-mannanase